VDQGKPKITKEKFKIGKYFGEIPLEKMASPAGIIALVLAVAAELIDLLLVTSGIDLIPEALIHGFFLLVINTTLGVPVKGQIIYFVIGCIPVLSDFFPETLMNWVVPIVKFFF